MEEQENFYVECDVCKQRLKNWVGSTPCCGSIAYIVEEDGTVSKSLNLFVSINGSIPKPTKISI